jgi:hypothetical protein
MDTYYKCIHVEVQKDNLTGGINRQSRRGQQVTNNKDNDENELTWGVGVLHFRICLLLGCEVARAPTD